MRLSHFDINKEISASVLRFFSGFDESKLLVTVKSVLNGHSHMTENLFDCINS